MPDIYLRQAETRPYDITLGQGDALSLLRYQLAGRYLFARGSLRQIREHFGHPTEPEFDIAIAREALEKFSRTG